MRGERRHSALHAIIYFSPLVACAKQSRDCCISNKCCSLILICAPQTIASSFTLSYLFFMIVFSPCRHYGLTMLSSFFRCKTEA